MTPTNSMKVVERRFWKKVDRSGDCWVWLSGLNSQGYGRFRNPFMDTKSKRVLAHRFSWSLANGPIPDGMLVLHTCDNPKCVNPGHLFLGDHSDNAIDCVRKRRHQAFTKRETYWRGKKMQELRRRQKRGLQMKGPKITRADAAIIRASTDPVQLLCSRFGLDQSTVYKIKKGTIWAIT